MSPEPAPVCLRCPGTPLVPNGSGEPLTFWVCRSCRRDFTLHEDGVLTERWLGSLSGPLYLAQFDTHPQWRAPSSVAALRNADLPRMLADIELELNDPTQPVSRILPTRASEEELREYLRLVADEIRAQLDSAG